MVRDPEIEYLMQACEEPATTADMLYKAVIRGGGQDNTYLVIVEYGAPFGNTEAPPFALQQEQNTALLLDEDGECSTNAYMSVAPRWRG